MLPPSWQPVAAMSGAEFMALLFVACCFSTSPGQTSSENPVGRIREEPATMPFIRPLPAGAVRRLGNGSNPFLCLAFSPDGKTLASAGYEKTIQLWDVATGKEVRKWIGWEGNYTALAFSPDGRLLASGSLGDHFIHLWEATTGRETCTLGELPQGASSVSFSPDGKMLAAGGYRTDEIFLWEVPSGKEMGRLTGRPVPFSELATAGPPGFSYVAFAPDAKTLASGHLHGLSRIWSTRTLGELQHFRGPLSDSFVHQTFSPDGTLLATWGEMIRLYSTRTWKQIRYFGDQPNLRISCTAFSSDGRMLASGSTGQEIGDNRVHLWEVATGSERCALAGHQYTVSALAFSPDGNLLVSGSRDGTALVWDVRHLPQLGRQLKVSSPDPLQNWRDLQNEDAGLAYRSMAAFIRRPDLAVPFLKERLRPVFARDRLQISQLCSELDSNVFELRERSAGELAAQVDVSASQLRKEASGPIGAEARRRLQFILATWDDARFSGEQLQSLRALEILERIGTRDALNVIGTIAAGQPGFRVTQAAKASVARLSKRCACQQGIIQ
jgi:WD40 repeat protein